MTCSAALQTACCHSVAIGHTDMCFANVWTTPSRRAIVSFTGTIYSDEYNVIASYSKEDGPNTIRAATFGTFLLPFSQQLWLIITAMCVWVGFVYFIIEGTVNEEDFADTQDPAAGLAGGIWYALLGILSGGDIRLTPTTFAGSLVLIAFSCCILVLVASYTATITTSTRMRLCASLRA